VIIFNQTLIPQLKKYINIKVAFTEMPPRIPWELAADPLRSTDQASGTTTIEE
jgi:hypothetical protein